MTNWTTTTSRLLCGAVLAVSGLTMSGLTAQSEPLASDVQAPGAWDQAAVDAFATLPVQENGRVKPLDTVLQFKMYRVHQKRSMRVPDEERFGAAAGTTLHPTEWALGVLLYPEWAAQLPSFTITDSDVLEAIGLADEVKRKRDRYSYDTLRPKSSDLSTMVQPIQKLDEKKRDLLQKQLIALYGAMFDYAGLERSFDFARHVYEVPEADRDLFGGAATARTSDVLVALPKLFDRYRGTQPSVGVRQLLADVEFFCTNSWALAWIPPTSLDEEQWLTVNDVYDQASFGGVPEPYLEALRRAERVATAVADGGGESLRDAAQTLQQLGKERAVARGEYGPIELEVSNYRADYYGKALYAFMGAFLLLCGSWLFAGNRLLPRLSFGLNLVGLGFLVTGIVVRCIVRSRPPVTGLYDTILFISAVLVMVALIIEWIHRRGIGLTVASLLGALGMFLSFKFELTSGRDTMDPLIAVLDTNFWLSTHVTTVTMGYSAGMLAGGLAWVFLLGKLFGLKRGEPAFYRSLGKMVYGSVAFGVVFSTVGTILGGVWANDSWGRFWGWDPKENGALMIVLWNLIILHCRMGGYIRNWGIALMSVLGAMVVAFSWWGVNLLGVGLHSYGFTAGIDNALNIFYLSSLLVFGLGVFAMFRERGAERVAAQAASSPEPEAA